MAPGQAPITTLLNPHPKRRDWFVIPDEWVTTLAPAPVVDLLPNGKVAVHRSHLALLAPSSDLARATLHAIGGSAVLAAREVFDAQTSQQGWKLRTYQHEAREFIRARRGVLLADQMRLGKTAAALCSHELSDGPLLIVAPLATREVWKGWIARRWPDIEPLVLTGREQTVPSEDLLKHPVVFAHYDVISAWRNIASVARIGTVIFDEAHLLANAKAKRTTAALMLSARADRVIALTGTPMWNRPSGLWAILAAVNPGAWGKWYDFAVRYCDGHPGTHGFIADGHSNEDEFKTRLREVMLRRTWEDVLSDLPPIERTVEVVDVTEEQHFQLDRLAEQVRVAQTRRTPVVGHVARLRRLLGRLKLATAIDVAKRAIGSDGSAVVWAWHRDVAHAIAAEVSKDANVECYVVTGDNSVRRDAILATWRKTGGLLAITIGVGQAGIDLSGARQAIFAEADWTPAVIAQAEMRTFAATRSMAVTYVIADHLVDRAIVDTLGKKCANADAIGVPAAESAMNVLSRAFGLEEVADMDRVMRAFLSADSDGEEG